MANRAHRFGRVDERQGCREIAASHASHASDGQTRHRRPQESLRGEIMKSKILPTIARVLLGLMFTVFGLNGFLHFIPEPKTPMPEGAAAFAGALMNTGYMFQLVS